MNPSNRWVFRMAIFTNESSIFTGEMAGKYDTTLNSDKNSVIMRIEIYRVILGV